MYMSMDTAGQDLKQIPALDAKAQGDRRAGAESLTQWRNPTGFQETLIGRCWVGGCLLALPYSYLRGVLDTP